MPPEFFVNERAKIRPEVVSLLVNGQGEYADLLTPPPTRTECQAALDYLELVRDHNNEVAAQLQRAMDLLAPYTERIIRAASPAELAAAVIALQNDVGEEVAGIHQYLGLMLGNEV